MERRRLCLIAWTIAAGIVIGALSGCNSQCVANSRPTHLIAIQNKTLSFTVKSLANTVRCEWLISSNTVNTRLRLTAAIFNLRSHDGSCVDIFTVYDGNASFSPILLSTCFRPNFPIYSSGSDVLVYFTTGSPYSGERSNFTVIYEVFRPSVADATITDSVNVTTTTLYFLKYPEGSTLYPNNANRAWVFHTNDSQYVVHITFINIDVEPSSGGCDYDYIEIFDSAMEANKVDRLCGHLTSREYYSTGQSLYITFHSDDSVIRTGFNLTYTAAPRSFIYPATACLYDIVLTGADQSQRYLQYPGNSRTYSNNVDCYWLLHTSSYDYVVHVTFTFVSTESNTDCSYDFVEVFDGTYSQRRKVFKLCGHLDQQREFYSSGQYLLIHFHSYASGTGQGFRLTYTSARRSAAPQDSYGACLQGGHLPVNYSTQYLIYPPRPMVYNTNVNCNWLLQTSYYDDVVHVTFTFVDMEADADCSYDYVQLFDGSSLFAPSLGKVCQFTSRDFYSSGSSMYIKFVSDSSTTGGGFEITYQAVSRYSLPTTTVTPTTCSLYPTSQTATSYTEKYVQYPTTSSNYTNNADCGWLFTAANYDYVVHVAFTSVDTEYDSDCDNDYIQVFDGSSSYSASLGKLCGTESRDYYSTGQSMFIKFHSDGSITGGGFNLTYTAVARLEVPGSSWNVPQGDGNEPSSSSGKSGLSGGFSTAGIAGTGIGITGFLVFLSIIIAVLRRCSVQQAARNRSTNTTTNNNNRNIVSSRPANGFAPQPGPPIVTRPLPPVPTVPPPNISIPPSYNAVPPTTISSPPSYTADPPSYEVVMQGASYPNVGVHTTNYPLPQGSLYPTIRQAPSAPAGAPVTSGRVNQSFSM